MTHCMRKSARLLALLALLLLALSSIGAAEDESAPLHVTVRVGYSSSGSMLYRDAEGHYRGYDAIYLYEIGGGFIRQLLTEAEPLAIDWAQLQEQAEADRVQQEKDSAEVYEPVGCQRCAGTGYFDRIGIYEIMEITPRMRTMISHRCDTGTLRETAIAEGMHTLRESARRLVLEGTTSISEMQRISVENMAEETHPLEDGA